MRVRLIPTGRCELLGLPACIERLFPGHTFETVAAREEPDGERVPFDSFTSSRLRPSLAPGNLQKLVAQLASEVYPAETARRRTWPCSWMTWSWRTSTRWRS